MSSKSPAKTHARLVLVTEEAEFADDASVFQTDLEAMSATRKRELVAVIETLGYEVIHYASPNQFLARIETHQNDLVLAPWSGAGSINRLSLMPAICEAANIRYIGADATTRAVCNDKDLSKLIARKAGFHTAPGVRVIPGDDLELAMSLRFPLIVKPCAEGTSIGIDRKSVCYQRSDVEAMVKRLQQEGFKHLLVEEFVVGREVCLCLMGDIDHPRFFGTVEITLSDNPTYLRTNPYDPRIKKGFWGERHLERLGADDFLRDMENAARAYRFLSRVQLFRIDGRVDDQGKFVFIEFATFPTFGLTSELTVGLSHHFKDYRDFISNLLELR